MALRSQERERKHPSMTALRGRLAVSRSRPSQPGTRSVLLAGVQASARLLVQHSVPGHLGVREIGDGRQVSSLVSGHPARRAAYRCLPVTMRLPSPLPCRWSAPDVGGQAAGRPRQRTCAGSPAAGPHRTPSGGLERQGLSTGTGWTAVCTALRMRRRFTKPRCPWTNGRAERSNRTLQTGWAYAQAWTSDAQRAAAFDRLRPAVQHSTRPLRSLRTPSDRPLRRLTGVNNVPGPTTSVPPDHHRDACESGRSRPSPAGLSAARLT